MKPTAAAEPESSADHTDTRAQDAVPSPIAVRSAPLTLLAFLALAVTVTVARPFLLAIAFAWLLTIALAPAVQSLRRIGIPSAVGAAVVPTVVLGAIGYAAFALAGPAAEWAEELPQSIDRIAAKLRALRASLSAVEELSDRVGEIAESSDGAVQVEVQDRANPIRMLLTGATAVVGSVAVTVALVYFMLATDDAFLTKIVGVLPRLRDKIAVVRTVRAIESRIARYLVAITLINTGLGVALWGAFALLGVPNPALWGAVAALANFVPYLGAAAGIVVIGAGSLLTFDTAGEALAPPLAYAALNGAEGLLITPAILGRSLALSPVVIFLWVMLWGWIWGVPGALIAVPLLTAVKIALDHVPRLEPFGRLLGR